MGFTNCYEDAGCASAYATLEFKNTYYLAYRDLPAIFAQHVKGTKAFDFGCGAGRSTRFLRRLGFDATGADISEEMLRMARQGDPAGDYRLVPGDDLRGFPASAFNLVFSGFTFDNIQSNAKVKIFSDLGRLLTLQGVLVNLVSSPEIYTHEWASFTTKAFPENAHAESGDVVRIVVTDHQDSRPVEDIVCSDEAYQEIYRDASLRVDQTYKPLAKDEEPYTWISETRIAPWVIYVLRPLTTDSR